MPCPDFDVSIIQRSKGRSAVASSAYQSGSRIFCEYDQEWKNFTGKYEIIHEEILLPSNAPPEYADRSVLWNAVEDVEPNWNSQLARKLRLSFPKEVPVDQYAAMVRGYCQEQFVSKGMIADIAIHDKEDGNPHAHIQLTMRSMDESGRWNPKSHKIYVLDENGERIRLPSGNWKSEKQDVVDWNDQKYCEIWRTAWADIQNTYLERNARPERADLRSYERQGIDRVPMVHMGPAAAALEAKGIETNIGNLNRDIAAYNQLMDQIRNAIRKLTTWIEELSEKRKRILELLQERPEPTLVDLLRDYLEVRSEERSGWSAYSQLSGTVADHEKISDAIEYLSENKIVTVDDLKARLDDVSSTVSDLKTKIRDHKKRIRIIDSVIDRYETYQRLCPLNAEYLKKNFKTAKDRFYTEHKAELDEFRKAYRYLMKNGAVKDGGDLILAVDDLTAERDVLAADNLTMQSQVDAVTDDLTALKNVRYYVSKVQPEPEEVEAIVRADPEQRTSVRERLKEKQKEIAERETAAKHKKKKIER